MVSNSNQETALDEVIRQLQVGTAIPTELWEVYGEEAEDHLRTIYEGLSRLTNDNNDMAALADVRRASHTLKGAAGAVGLNAVTRIAHRMEDLLDFLAETKQGVSEKRLALLLATVDQLQELTTGDFHINTVAQQIVDLYENYAMVMGQEQNKSSNPAPTVTSPDHRPVPSSAAENNSSPVVHSPSTQYLRVPVDRLDDLVGLLGEMIVNRSEFQHRLDDFESRIEDMQSTLERLRNAAHYVESYHHRQVTQCQPVSSPGSDVERFNTRSRQPGGWGECRDEFDPLEFEQYTDFHLLGQTLAEADNDAEIMSGEFRSVKSSIDSLLRRQQQLNREAQKSLMRIRMVPLAEIVSRLDRTVRTVSNKLGRQAELEFVGEKIELDKTVLDEIIDPLSHLLRNAIDHGVEDADVRKAAGKPEAAQLQIKAFNHGTQVTLRICDDGAGINLKKIREKALKQGLIEPDQTLSDGELRALIFLPGFSTASHLTDVSGRGVGMDVVSDAVRRLKGSIRVDSEPGLGTTFTIQLPTSLGSIRVLLVESNGRTFAIPMQSIQTVQKLDPTAVMMADNQAAVKLAGGELRLIDLATHLQISTPSTHLFEHPVPMLMLSIGENEVAMTVDSILGSQDVIVKSLGDHLKNVHGIMGATINGDGSVIPILDASELVEPRKAGRMPVSSFQRQSTSAPRRRLAMVVDDSISVRRLTQNLLTSSGWEVVTAKDGVDALEKLAALDTPPDVFLCDMEMPRMDGLELIRQIRDQAEFELTPIVMVTSRASEKHRHKAFDAGATDYVVKPYHDKELLELIAQLIQSVRETVRS